MQETVENRNHIAHGDETPGEVGARTTKEEIFKNYYSVHELSEYILEQYDLTASSLPDVVPISVIPENKTSHAAPALQDAAAHYDNSHMVQITAGKCAVIQDQLQMNPSGSSLFLFCGRRTNRIKGLIWEDNRFLLLYKRPEDGTFS